MGRAKLARDNVQARGWWRNYVRVINNDDNQVMEDEVPPTYIDGSVTQDCEGDNFHIGWIGPDTLYPAWRKNGAKPEHTLFYHIRPDAWDAKQSWSRWQNNCENPKCINPFHAEFKVSTKNTLTFDRAKDIARSQGDHVFDNVQVHNAAGTIRECVLMAYVGIMTDDAFHPLLDANDEGNLVINNSEIANMNQDTIQMWGLQDNRTIVALSAILRKRPTIDQVYAVQKRMIEDRKNKRKIVADAIAEVTNEQ
jgi:hypothetical protein